MNLLTEQNLVRLKVGLYGGLLFFSFFIIIAIPVTTSNITLNICFLYTDPKDTGSDSNCNYPVAIAVIWQLLYAIFRIGTLVLLILGKFNNEFILFTDMFQLIYTVVDLLGLFFTFIGACIISAGINSTCGSDSWQTDDCDLISKALGDGSAVSRMRTAEAGAWISFIIWLVLVVSGVFWLFRQGKLPFVSGPAATGDTSAGATAPAPNMDTPPAADEPKY